MGVPAMSVLSRSITALLALLVFAACSPPTAAPTPAPAAPAPTAVPAAAAPTTAPTNAAVATPAAETSVSGEIVVFAASSLTDAFQDMATAFQQANPNAKLAFNFGASSQ